MEIDVLVLAIALLVPVAAHAKDKSPADVKAFLRNADTCVHLSGEWDSELSREEKDQIQRGIDKYCGAAKKQLDKLSIKYANDPSIQKKLAEYDDSVKLYRKE